MRFGTSAGGQRQDGSHAPQLEGEPEDRAPVQAANR